MATGNKKKGTANPVPPSPSNANKDVHAAQVLRAFQDMKDKNRLEITAMFDEHNNGTKTIPSVIPTKKKK